MTSLPRRSRLGPTVCWLNLLHRGTTWNRPKDAERDQTLLLGKIPDAHAIAERLMFHVPDGDGE